MRSMSGNARIWAMIALALLAFWSAVGLVAATAIRSNRQTLHWERRIVASLRGHRPRHDYRVTLTDERDLG